MQKSKLVLIFLVLTAAASISHGKDGDGGRGDKLMRCLGETHTLLQAGVFIVTDPLREVLIKNCMNQRTSQASPLLQCVTRYDQAIAKRKAIGKPFPNDQATIERYLSLCEKSFNTDVQVGEAEIPVTSTDASI